jgi:hypothetical protein
VSGLAGEDAAAAYDQPAFGDAQLGKPFTAAALLGKVAELLNGRP